MYCSLSHVGQVETVGRPRSPEQILFACCHLVFALLKILDTATAIAATDNRFLKHDDGSSTIKCVPPQFKSFIDLSLLNTWQLLPDKIYR